MGKIKEIMSKKLSTTIFTLSMIILFTVGVAFLISLHVLVNPAVNQVAIKDYQPVTSKPISLTLDLSSPDDNSLVFDNNLLVSGKTTSGAMVLITLNDDNQLIDAGNQGNFSLTIKLQLGGNQLIISSFDNLGNYKSESRTIYYSEEKL